MVGRCPSNAASRSHIVVCGSSGPIDRYSAMPSMNHSGGFTLISVCTPAPMRPRLNTSYWNWWTISWPIVLELFIGPGERQHHPVLEELRDAAGALADVAADGVGLLEVRMGRVQQDRLAALELVVEHAREASVPALGNAGRVERGRPLGRVVVDVEVLRLDDAKIEGAVLDLVLPEVLRRGGQRAGERQRHRRCRGPSHPAHGFERPPRAPVASTGASPQSRSSW